MRQALPRPLDCAKSPPPRARRQFSALPLPLLTPQALPRNLRRMHSRDPALPLHDGQTSNLRPGSSHHSSQGHTTHPNPIPVRDLDHGISPSPQAARSHVHPLLPTFSAPLRKRRSPAPLRKKHNFKRPHPPQSAHPTHTFPLPTTPPNSHSIQTPPSSVSHCILSGILPSSIATSIRPRPTAPVSASRI